MKSSIIIVLSAFVSTDAFLTSISRSRTSTPPSTIVLLASTRSSRSDFLRDIATIGFSAATSTVAATGFFPNPAYADEITPSGVAIKVTKAGNGPAPKIGELAAIRFASFQGENKIDDIFVTAEPYYTRVGSGGLIKGVEEVLPKMRVGDRWVLTIPGELAFGPKGRPASAGKPRIPANAEIVFDVEMVGLPGREQELIELIGGDE